MNTTLKHPKGLYVLFATEMWERFNYYGLRAILVLFMAKALYFDKILSSNLYGSYTSLIYLSPLLGGYIADKYWGNKKSIILGGLVMSLGQFILFFAASLYKPNLGIETTLLNTVALDKINFQLILFFCGLGCMIAGNGFFKANISSLVGQLYEDNDSRKNAAYTYFYMGINLGGAFGPYICGLLGDTGNPADFKWGFLAGGIGMLLSVAVQLLFHNKYVKNPAGKILGNIPIQSNKKMLNPIFIILGLVGLIILSIVLLMIDTLVVNYLFYLLISCFGLIALIVFSDKSLTIVEKRKVVVIFIVSFFVIFFWGAFEQAGASLTFFANEQTNRNISLFNKNFLIPTSWFQSINSTFVIVLASVFAWVWEKLGDKGPNAYIKLSLGLFLLSLSYLWIAFGVDGISPTTKVSIIWLVGMYFLQTCGELFLSPIGMSLVNHLSPIKYASLLMAVWFTSNASANKLAGVLSALYPDKQPTHLLGFTIHNLHEFFIVFVIMSGIASLILLLISKKLVKLAK